ncbi:SIS domain-containing protein [Micromonospora siamensis]|uniref:Glutamine--fructose-6-phosphate aminotransferase [isomerizing] n=1 Tax=Micromonospora siamensis TaxID=299152 RepID=A0A1C5J2D8_9ACTN|nr:SIS domain-containing protein [Micromonospora siamensis]SCG64740.1 glucosamine--fructose-6-phosphate aminotransferase (isomerizing) [Micromonospora siamensis]
MCGIVALLPRYDRLGEAVAADHVLGSLTWDLASPEAVGTVTVAGASELLTDAHRRAEKALALLSAPATLGLLAADPGLQGEAIAALDRTQRWLDGWDAVLDGGAQGSPEEVEAAQAQAVVVRDLLWMLRNDRLAAARRMRELGFGDNADAKLAVSYLSVDSVLDAIDRLEVRGRDSAGVQLWVGLDDADRKTMDTLAPASDPKFRSGAVEMVGDGVVFVYKRAAILGSLGDNVAHLRASIVADERLATALRLPSARISVLAHSRWASVGRISEANAHPVNSVAGDTELPYSAAVLNGDIDNHVELRRNNGIVTDEITTDAKLIPVMYSAALRRTMDPGEALTSCVAQFHGSMAIGVQDDAGHLTLAQKGSGQGLYVGLADWCYIVASEVYGLVALTDRYLRVDGSATDGGVVVVLDGDNAGTLEGITEVTSAGVAAPERVQTAEITTRDVARGDFDHYLVKEIAGAPRSFRRSLRGRIAEVDGLLQVSVGESGLPAAIREDIARGRFREVVLVGQGTAAVACQGIAEVIRPHLPGLAVRAVPATELSATDLPQDMSGILLIAVSQSGTTTDTNRAVDLVVKRGAAAVAIVNRRDSDLAHKTHGVLYTSDGRDVEMAVASTKAFYSQVATGVLLGLQIARAWGKLRPEIENDLLVGLLEMPAHLTAVQGLTDEVAAASREMAAYPSWAVVGSGPNRVAAAEVRIKLSELCYRTVSTDALEDKKHIDLSAEAMIIVCAAGTPPQQVRDMAKEIEIYAAHKNAPVVIADEGVDIAWAAQHVIRVPRAHPALAWLLSTAVGHLISYHSARAIDELALPLRQALTLLEERVDQGAAHFTDVAELAEPVEEFLAEVATGRTRGVLSPEATLSLANVLLSLRGLNAGLPMRADELGEPLDYVRDQLTASVEELTRSIDSVKHQAKTVTVGTSRDDNDLLENPLTQALVAAGSDVNLLTYPVLLALRAHAPLVGEVTGAVRYRVDRAGDESAIRVLAKSGEVADTPSRADNGTRLTGSKRYAVDARMIQLVRGRTDDRLVLMVPEQVGAHVSGLTLLHVALVPAASAAALTNALQTSGTRLAEIDAAVTETEATFDPAMLEQVPVEKVLVGSVGEVAGALLAR